MQVVATIISAVLILAACPPYIIDTLKHKTKPERITWLIFSALGIIAFVSQLSLGASWSLLFSGLDTAASVLVFALSIKFGAGGHTKSDVAAFIISAVGVIIAVQADEPIISLLGVILADVSGVVLTLRKVYLRPQSETTISWLLIGTAALFGVLSVGKFSFGLLLYPVYLLTVNYAVPVTQWISSRQRFGLAPQSVPIKVKN